MPFPAMDGAVAAAGGGSPLDYSNLVAFWESETGVTESSGEVTEWTDQSANAIDLTVPGSNGSSPDLESNSQNGFDGISFEEFIEAEPINKKLFSADSALDNIFHGSGFKTIAFAGRWDRTADFNFNLPSVICSKGVAFGGIKDGWVLRIEPNGSLVFRHFMTNGSFWECRASGFFTVGDLVLGSITYDGGNSSGSGSFRLWNGSNFVETGTVSTASSSTKKDDSSKDFILGNMRDDSRPVDNSPFEGPLFSIWITKPSQLSLDNQYQQRYIP